MMGPLLFSFNAQPSLTLLCNTMNLVLEIPGPRNTEHWTDEHPTECSESTYEIFPFDLYPLFR